jgi:hypothetical protein
MILQFWGGGKLPVDRTLLGPIHRHGFLYPFCHTFGLSSPLCMIPCPQAYFLSAMFIRSISGEEVSVSLDYALGLWTDQTPPIRVSKRNTAGKEQNQVGSQEGKLGEMGM